jgi:hypothetical protein
MEKIYKFHCGKCEHEWKENDGEFNGISVIDITISELSDYQQGFQCPNCQERNDIGGEEVK